MGPPSSSEGIPCLRQLCYPQEGQHLAEGWKVEGEDRVGIRAQDAYPAPQDELFPARPYLRGPQAGVTAALCPRVTLRDLAQPREGRYNKK